MSHMLTSSFSFSGKVSALPVCSRRSGSTLAVSILLTSVEVGDGGGDLLELILGRCFDGKAGGTQLVDIVGEGVRL